MSKVDYEVFQSAMLKRGESAELAIDAIAAYRVAGKPLIVEGIESENHIRFLKRHWSLEKHGLLYGQGYAVMPGQPWDNWTSDLKSYGLAGGHVLSDRRRRKTDNTQGVNASSLRARRG